jgi:cobalt-zinc-cadmium efflux system membrane fusion protein
MISCGRNNKNDTTTEATNDLISISSDQFKTNNMDIGEPVMIRLDEQVRCNGKILVEPSANAMVSSSVPGLIRNIACKEGLNVRAGQILFDIAGNDFIELQKDYAEAQSQLKRIKSEYERVKSLFDERVGSEKDLMMAESEYRSANAKYYALKMKINMLGLDETKIIDGNFYQSFSVRSPINGYLNQIYASLGQYTDQQTPLAEILDISRLELRIAVFEKDLGLLENNQKIIFNLLGNTNKTFTANLKSIGRNVENDSKTIMCYAEIDDLDKTNFVNNAYVEATIITKSDSVTAVPEEAILKSEGKSYLLEYVKNENGNYFLKKTNVSPGRLYNGYVELLYKPDIGKVLTRGAYYIRIE